MSENIPYENEVNAAAKWWADHLRRKVAPSRIGVQDAATHTVDQSMLMLSARKPDIDEMKILKFQSELTLILDRMCIQSGWNPKNPMWGGLHRTISVDWNPDHYIEEAAEAAGIDWIGRYLPIKTHMWINPNSVTVREGYHEAIKTIYPEPQGEIE